MPQKWAKAFYKSPAWLKNRRNYMQRPVETEFGTVPPMMCERCFARGEYVPAKVVHHREHLTPENIGDPHVALSYDNLQRLCQDCHAAVHSATPPDRMAFAADGSIAGPTEADSFMARVQRLTESADERRNIHSSRGRRGDGRGREPCFW